MGACHSTYYPIVPEINSIHSEVNTIKCKMPKKVAPEFNKAFLNKLKY